jgi:hypothetical protein
MRREQDHMTTQKCRTEAIPHIRVSETREAVQIAVFSENIRLDERASPRAPWLGSMPVFHRIVERKYLRTFLSSATHGSRARCARANRSHARS